jgi:hypothetical protein
MAAGSADDVVSSMPKEYTAGNLSSRDLAFWTYSSCRCGAACCSKRDIHVQEIGGGLSSCGFLTRYLEKVDAV